MDKIVNQAVEKIKKMPDGTQFTVAELLANIGVDTKDTKKMFTYYKLIYAQISNIVKTPDEYMGAFAGLPFNIPLEVVRR